MLIEVGACWEVWSVGLRVRENFAYRRCLYCGGLGFEGLGENWFGLQRQVFRRLLV